MSICKNTEDFWCDFRSSNISKNKEIKAACQEFGNKCKMIIAKTNYFISSCLNVQNDLDHHKRTLNWLTKLNAVFKRKDNINFKVEKELESLCQIDEKLTINLTKNFGFKKEIYLNQARINLVLAKEIIKTLLRVNDFESVRNSYLNKIDLSAHKKLRNSIIDILTEDLKEILYNIVLESKQSDLINQAASNAITLLNKYGFSFSNKDLSRIKIPNADLSSGLFINTNFESSYLYGVNFSMANIYDSNFRNCNMVNANFGEILNFDLEERAKIFQFSPCGRFLAIATESKIILYDTKTYHEIVQFTGEKHIYSLLFSDDGNYFARNLELSVVLWDTSNMHQIAEFMESGVCSFSYCNNYLCLWKIYSERINLEIYSIKTNKIVNEISWDEFRSAHFSASGENLIILNDYALFIWNLSTKAKINEIKEEFGNLILSFDRKFIALLDDECTFLYSSEKLELLRVFQESYGYKFSFYGRYLLTYGRRNIWKVFDLWNDKKTFQVYSYDALFFPSNGKSLLYKKTDSRTNVEWLKMHLDAECQHIRK